jgi:serine/threonine protein kinase
MGSNFCQNYFWELSRAVEQENTELVKKVINMKNNELICVQSDTTYNTYSENLAKRFSDILNNLGSSDTCNSIIINTLVNNATKENLGRVMKAQQVGGVKFSDNGIETMVELVKEYFKKCYCKRTQVFTGIISKYAQKYFSTLTQGNTSDTNVKEKINEDYQQFKNLIESMKSFKLNFKGADISDISSIISVRGELEKLLPEELGTMKQFFITIIATYFEQLHPVIWAQIFSKACQQLFVDLPMSYDEIFAFGSKQLLTNSGPYILKILQMVRPILTPELKQKYNLGTLKYPLLTSEQINMIMDKVFPAETRKLYKVKANFSASVGHVCLLTNVMNPNKPVILKIIKPLSIVQSCWEYKTLSNIFPKGTCERNFVVNMLESNARELKVDNEIANINEAYDHYTCDYDEIFGFDTGHKLTTLENIEGIIDESCWYALTVSLAPGVSLSKLVESDADIVNNSSYVTSLHRCLDLLIYKFFNTLFHTGFYHGDLHAGNIFFSYKTKQMTLIDFGAVGHLDFFSTSTREEREKMDVLIKILVKSLFSNFGEILDDLSAFMNTLCMTGDSKVDVKVDMNSSDYAELKKTLEKMRDENILNKPSDSKISERNVEKFFSQETIEAENYVSVDNKEDIFNYESMYSYLDIVEFPTETIVEDDVRNPINGYDLKLEKSKQHDLVSILEEIFKFYAKVGVNIAIKFGDLYEFQKAYALILGVLKQVKYDGTRMEHIMRKSIVNMQAATKIVHVTTVGKFVSNYLKEMSKFNALDKKINGNN